MRWISSWPGFPDGSVLAGLPLRARVELAVQRTLGQVLSIFWILTGAFLLYVVMGYRIRDAAEVRSRFRSLIRNDRRPLLICANHLTMIDSALVAWALGGSWWYLFNYSRMPWNLPEQANFSQNRLNRMVVWLVKCIPVSRGGSREKVSGSLEKVKHVLSRGETALVFPEGGRSRTGRVQAESATYGVGRVLEAVPECRTVCVYLRGDHQESWSTVPRRGDRFSVDFRVIEPLSDHSGLRRARDLSLQIVGELVKMEEEYFARRK